MKKRKGQGKIYAAAYFGWLFGALILPMLAFEVSKVLSIILFVLACIILGCIITGNVFESKSASNEENEKLYKFYFFFTALSVECALGFSIAGIIWEIVNTIREKSATAAWVFGCIGLALCALSLLLFIKTALKAKKDKEGK